MSLCTVCLDVFTNGTLFPVICFIVHLYIVVSCFSYFTAHITISVACVVVGVFRSCFSGFITFVTCCVAIATVSVNVWHCFVPCFVVAVRSCCNNCQVFCLIFTTVIKDYVCCVFIYFDEEPTCVFSIGSHGCSGPSTCIFGTSCPDVSVDCCPIQMIVEVKFYCLGFRRSCYGKITTPLSRINYRIVGVVVVRSVICKITCLCLIIVVEYYFSRFNAFFECVGIPTFVVFNRCHQFTGPTTVEFGSVSVNVNFIPS